MMMVRKDRVRVHFVLYFVSKFIVIIRVDIGMMRMILGNRVFSLKFSFSPEVAHCAVKIAVYDDNFPKLGAQV